MSKPSKSELDDLRMAAARFAVDFQTKPAADGIPLPDGTRVAFDGNGMDRVEFLVAPNPGEGLKPLARIASGGETSRLMLALKTCSPAPTRCPRSSSMRSTRASAAAWAGRSVKNSGGSAAPTRCLSSPTCRNWLSSATSTSRCRRSSEKNRTLTRVTRLTGEPRTLELAQMLGAVTEGTIRSAHDILQSAQTFKTG